jgi:glutamate-1-semialdehyde 2,1-aminomutase
MLAKGFLAATGVYVSTEHTEQIVFDYLEELEPIFALIKECENGKDPSSLLKGPVCHSGFKRLN